MDGAEFHYSSDEEENLEVDVDIVHKNKRGKGKEFYTIRTHATMAIAVASMDTINRKKGRRNRGVTLAVYYHCKFKSCGCNIEWRLVTSLHSFEVIEEESVGQHTGHELLKRNGGRGLSFDQVAMLATATRLMIRKPSTIITYFENIAREILTEGKITHTLHHLIQLYLSIDF